MFVAADGPISYVRWWSYPELEDGRYSGSVIAAAATTVPPAWADDAAI